jgi:site-specific DNA-methyltransferase (adenine-specific)
MSAFYQDDHCTIYHGDALDLMREMGDESVDIVVTSPPYNMGLTPGGNGRGMYRHTTQKATRFGDGYTDEGDDSLDPEEYAALRCAELWEMWRIARLGVFWNHRPRIIHGRLVDPLEQVTAHDPTAAELPPVRQRIILNRGTGIDVNVNQFCTRGEYLYLFAKPAFRLVDHAASGMGDVWDVGIAREAEHPAPFPLSVPARCIAATGAQSVLDPFLGSGTTLRAAKDAGIVGIGIERSARYCEVAVKRLAQEVLAL